MVYSFFIEILKQNTFPKKIFFKKIMSHSPRLDVLLHRWRPLVLVTLVDGVDLPLGGNAHARVGQDELPDRRVKHEAVHLLGLTIDLMYI